MLIDLLIILLGILAVYRGRQNGFLRQFWASVGFFAGLFIGGLLLSKWLDTHLAELATTPETYAVLIVMVVLGTALAGLNLGEYLGLRLKLQLKNSRLNQSDNLLGGILGVVATTFSVWLLASLASNLPGGTLSRAVNDSKVIQGLNKVLPAAPEVIAGLGRLVDPNGFPDVFIGSEPIPRGEVDLPELGEFASTVNAVKDSVVRIKGQGCGGVIAGSGFVVGNGLIATNAHVVAGIDEPLVQDVNGVHRAVTIWFDPDLDFAILRTSGLAGKPLALATDPVEPVTPAVVLGYPGGGDFNASAAAVLNRLRASGRDIYGQERTLRQIYEIQAEIAQGSSGGPLVNKAGQVIGVIFAESTSYDHVGYALTTAAVRDDIRQASTRQTVVSTGSCVD